MSIPSDAMNHRVVSRFLDSKSSAGGLLARRAYVLRTTFPEICIPDAAILESSEGCTLKSEDVERMLPTSRDVMQGSVRFQHVPASSNVNRTRFEARSVDGKRISGTITVSLVASDRRLDAFSVIDLDG